MDAKSVVLFDWAEVLAILLALVGLVIGIALQNPLLNYAVILLAGFVSGQILQQNRKVRSRFPIALVILGFFGGFLIGSFGSNRTMLTVMFVVGNYIAYWLYDNDFLPLVKGDDFEKL